MLVAGLMAYFLIGAIVFWINATAMPCTFPLAVFRGAVWPLAWVGIIRGRPLPMD